MKAENCPMSYTLEYDLKRLSPVPPSPCLLYLSSNPERWPQGTGVALYLDVHPGPAQKAQCGVSGTVSPQGHLLFQLLQASLQLGPPGGKGSEGSASPALLATGTAGEGRKPERKVVPGI